MRLKEELQKVKDAKKEKFHPTKEDVSYWFKLINCDIFLGELTPFSKLTIKPMRAMWGCVYYDDEIKNCELELHLSDKFPNKMHFINVLAHELVHKWQLEINIDTGNHNKHFFAWRKTFTKHGLNLSREI